MQSACLFVCPLAYLKNHTPKLHKISLHVPCGCGSVLLLTTMQYVMMYFGFVDNVMFSHKRAYVQRVSVSGRQRKEGWSFSASALPLSALPSTKGHPSAVTLTVHNRVWTWKHAMRCAQLIMTSYKPFLSCNMTSVL